MNDLAKIIEGVLLVSGQAQKRSALARIVGRPKQEIDDAIKGLDEQLSDRGIRIFISDDTVGLVSAPEIAEFTKKLIHEELETNLSKSAIETLTIILYKAPVTRAAIDYIRGVNSSYTLQQLLTRGIIDRNPNPQDSRSYVYSPSSKFITHMGLLKPDDLPAFEELEKEGDDRIEKALNEIESTEKNSDQS